MPPNPFLHSIISQKSPLYQSAISSKNKKKPPSSDQQTNEQQFENRKQLSLKLFKGIKQLQEPEPEPQSSFQPKEQFICHDRIQQMAFTLKNYPSTVKNNIKTLSETQLQTLLTKIIHSCSALIQNYILIFSTHLNHLNQKINNLKEKTHQLPLTIQHLKTIHNRHIFQTNHSYEKDIQQLNFKMTQLEKQISSSKSLSSGHLSSGHFSSGHTILDKLCSLKIVPETKGSQKNVAVKSLPQHTLTPLDEMHQEIEEKSLLEGIDQDLKHSDIKQASAKQLGSFVNPQYKTFEEQTVKKRQNEEIFSSPFKQIFETTIKKDKMPSENDRILMSFAKNHETIAIEQEMLSDSSEKYEDEYQVERNLSAKGKKKKSENFKNPQRSLKFTFPQLARQETLEYSLYEESQVEEFSIRQSPVINTRLSISKRKIPSLVEDPCLPEDMVLSKEERYLLSEIKHLRGIVKLGQEQVDVELSDGRDFTVERRSVGKIESVKKENNLIERELSQYKDELAKSRYKQKTLIDLLNKAKKQLKSMKKNLNMLVPCQYCCLSQHLKKL